MISSTIVAPVSSQRGQNKRHKNKRPPAAISRSGKSVMIGNVRVRLDGTPPTTPRDRYVPDIPTSNRFSALRWFRGKHEDSMVKAGVAFQWYAKLKIGSVLDWADMQSKFYDRFQTAERKVSLAELCSLRQKKGESAIDFIQRWREFSMQCDNPPIQQDAVIICRRGLIVPIKERLLAANIRSFDQLNIAVAEIEGFLAEQSTHTAQKGKLPKERNSPAKEVNAIDFLPGDETKGASTPATSRKKPEPKIPPPTLAELARLRPDSPDSTDPSLRRDHGTAQTDLCLRSLEPPLPSPLPPLPPPELPPSPPPPPPAPSSLLFSSLSSVRVGQTPLESARSKDPTRPESGSAGSDSPSRPDSAIHDENRGRRLASGEELKLRQAWVLAKVDGIHQGSPVGAVASQRQWEVTQESQRVSIQVMTMDALKSEILNCGHTDEIGVLEDVEHNLLLKLPAAVDNSGGLGLHEKRPEGEDVRQRLWAGIRISNPEAAGGPDSPSQGGVNIGLVWPLEARNLLESEAPLCIGSPIPGFGLLPRSIGFALVHGEAATFSHEKDLDAAPILQLVAGGGTQSFDEDPKMPKPVGPKDVGANFMRTSSFIPLPASCREKTREGGEREGRGRVGSAADGGVCRRSRRRRPGLRRLPVESAMAGQAMAEAQRQRRSRRRGRSGRPLTAEDSGASDGVSSLLFFYLLFYFL
ncbi:hypothetical protein Taro_011363 [Colocasia esculenta]|uniref:Retrotransposon gag domain-containing protein n=1 Tax=Colocasia esculenta TaxID=4460 RepID=A0A843UA13_COLES|nr:hypothetical protein [Colocasia esculenta]